MVTMQTNVPSFANRAYASSSYSQPVQYSGGHGTTTAHPAEEKKDSGPFGFLKSVAKSAVKVAEGATIGFAKQTLSSMFLGEDGSFSWSKAIKSAALVVGAGALCLAFPPAGILLGGYALSKSVPRMIDNTMNVVSLYKQGRYSEAEQASYNLGTSVTEVGLSAWGTASALRATGVTSRSTMEMIRNPKLTGKEVVQAFKENPKGQAFVDNVKTAWNKPTPSSTAGATSQEATMFSRAGNLYESFVKPYTNPSSVKKVWNDGFEYYSKPIENTITTKVQVPKVDQSGNILLRQNGTPRMVTKTNTINTTTSPKAVVLPSAAVINGNGTVSTPGYYYDPNAGYGATDAGHGTGYSSGPAPVAAGTAFDATI